MKFTVKQIREGEDEVILKYRSMTPKVRRIYEFLCGEQSRLVGQKGKTQVLLERQQILYIESVDGKTFAYTIEDVFQLEFTLAQLSAILSDINFFRCSKSMILNIDKVKKLNSLSSNRIDATMCNGEHIIISRTYASAFRRRLKEV